MRRRAATALLAVELCVNAPSARAMPSQGRPSNRAAEIVSRGAVARGVAPSRWREAPSVETRQLLLDEMKPGRQAGPRRPFLRVLETGLRGSGLVAARGER